MTGNYNFTDPSSGANYNIPRFTVNQQLTPQSAAIQDQSQQAKLNLATLGANQSGRIQGLLQNPIDLSGRQPAIRASERAGGIDDACSYRAAANRLRSSW